MVGLVLRALWRRRAPTGLLFLLAVIASTGAAAAPAYILGSIQSLAAGAIPGADPAARVVAVRGQRPRGSDLAADLAAFSAEVSRELDLRGFTPVAGAELTAAIGPVPGLLTDFAMSTGLTVACRRVVHIYRAIGGDVVALAGVDLSIGSGETLLPYASLHRNVILAQRRAARTRGVRLDDPDRVLDLVGLGGQGRARVESLPPGARQRAALAVGIAAGPGLLLVDEPTSQLDTAGRDEVVAALETVNAERGTTIVVVTHDGDVGARLGRAVTIRDGRVGAEGRDGRDFAVVAGDGTVQLPPDILEKYPPGTLFMVEDADEQVVLNPRTA